MSIASEITRLQGVKSDILTAIAAKGVSVPSGAMLDDCPELIASISGGGGSGGGGVINPFAAYFGEQKRFTVENGILTTNANGVAICLGGSYDFSDVEHYIFHTRVKAIFNNDPWYAFIFSRQKEDDGQLFKLSHYNKYSNYWAFGYDGLNDGGNINSNIGSSSRSFFSDSLHEIEFEYTKQDKATLKIDGVAKVTHFAPSHNYSDGSRLVSLSFGSDFGGGWSGLQSGSQIDLGATYLIKDGQCLFGNPPSGS